jgi:hypothetical protein
MLFVVALGVPLVAAGQAQVDNSSHKTPPPESFVEQVRRATEPFRDALNVPAGYGRALGCVSGPDQARWAFTSSTATCLATTSSIRSPKR